MKIENNIGSIVNAKIETSMMWARIAGLITLLLTVVFLLTTERYLNADATSSTIWTIIIIRTVAIIMIFFASTKFDRMIRHKLISQLENEGLLVDGKRYYTEATRVVVPLDGELLDGVANTTSFNQRKDEPTEKLDS